MDIILYLEALGLLMRVSQESIIFVGYRGMIRKLYEYEHNLNLEANPRSEEILIEGKKVNVRASYHVSLLFANIFYTLIYVKSSVSKNNIEEMVEYFAMYQKDINLKNFISEMLNILIAFGMIEKN